MELSALHIIFLTFKKRLIFFEDFYIEGKFTFLDMLGSLDEVNAQLTILRKEPSKLMPSQYSWNRKRILRHVSKSIDMPLCYSFDLSKEKPEIQDDTENFLEESKLWENYPSVFSILEEFYFFNPIPYIPLLLNPSFDDDRTIFSFKNHCILNGWSFIHAYFKDGDFSENDTLAIFDELTPFLEKKLQEIPRRFVLFLDIFRGPMSNLFETLDDLYQFFKRDVFSHAINVPCFPFEYFLNMNLDSIGNQIEMDLICPHQWDKSSLALYLQDEGISLENVKTILKVTGGFDDLVLREVFKLKGIPYDLKSGINKPILSGKYSPLLEQLIRYFDKQLKPEKLEQLVFILCQNKLFNECETSEVYIRNMKFLQFLHYAGLIDPKIFMIDFKDVSLINIHPLFWSHDVFPLV
jgi:hypothetical protein